MKYLIPVLIITIVLIAFSCKSNKYTPADYPDDQIIFGNGGGITGIYTHYYLFENGQLFKNSSTDETYQKVKKLKKQQVTQLFDNYDALNLSSYQFDEPGNMSYYLEFKRDGKRHKIQWGNHQKTVHPNVNTIFKILMKFVKE